MNPRIFPFAVVLAVSGILCRFPAHAQWMQTSGPRGGTITAIAALDLDLLVVSNLRNPTLSRSSNFGASWKLQSRLPAYDDRWDNYHFEHLLPVGDKLFLGAHGVFLSTDQGSSWMSKSDGLPVEFHVTAIENIGNILLVGGDVMGAYTIMQGIVFRSTNDGSSWTATNLTVPSGSVKSLLALDTMLLAGTTGGIFRSTDSGVTWSQMGVGIIDGVNLFAPWDHILFASNSNSGLLRSVDDGMTWTIVDSSTASKRIESFTALENRLFAGTRFYGVLFSTDSGATWSPANYGLPRFSPSVWVQSLAVLGSNIYAGTRDFGLFRSSDHGGSWEEINQRIVATGVWGLYCDGPLLFAGTQFSGATTAGRIFRSSDSGDSWIAPDTVLSGAYSFVRSGTNLFAGTQRGILRSSDNGAHWTAVTNGLPSPSPYYGPSLALIPAASGSENSYLFFGLSFPSGIFRSTNDGESWTAVNSGLTGSVEDLIVSGRDLFVATYGGGVFRSTNYGDDWISANNGIAITNIRSLGRVGETLFAGTFREFGSLYRSTDNGNSWTVANMGLPPSAGVYRFVASGTNLFASVSSSTQNGLFLSTNMGETWAQVTEGSEFKYAAPLAVNDDYIFLGGAEGVWRRPLSEMITSVERLSTDLPTDFSLDRNYPNPFNPSTMIEFSLPRSGFVTLKVFNVLGQEVASLVSEELAPGKYSTRWNAAGVASGVYFYRLTAHQTDDDQTGLIVETKKLMLLR